MKKVEDIQVGTELGDMHYQGQKGFYDNLVGGYKLAEKIRWNAPEFGAELFVEGMVCLIQAAQEAKAARFHYLNKMLVVHELNSDGDILCFWSYDAATLGVLRLVYATD